MSDRRGDGEDGAGDADLGVEVTKGLAAKPLQAAIGFTGVVVFARELGPAAIGGFYILLSLAQLIDFPVSGLSASVKKRYSEVDAPRSELFGLLVVGVALAVVLAGVGAAMFSSRLDVYAGIEGSAPLFIALFAGLVVFYPVQELLAATGRIGLQVWTDTVRSVFTLAAQLVFIIPVALGAVGLVAGYAVGATLALPAALYALAPSIAVPSRTTIRSVWSFAQYSSISDAIGKAYDRYDVLLLGLLAGPAAAGNYEVALRLVIPGSFVSGVLGSGLMATISNHHSRGNAVAETVDDAVSFASVLAVPLAFGAAALSEALVVTAYGAEYAAAAPLLVGLGVYQAINTQTEILRQTLYGLDRPRTQTLVAAVTLALNIVLGVILFRRLGAVGVVIATVAAESFRYLALVVVVRRSVPEVRLVTTPLAAQIVAGGVTFLAASATRRVVPVTSWATLLVVVGVGGVAYVLALFAVSGRVRDTVFGITRRLAAEYAG